MKRKYSESKHRYNEIIINEDYAYTSDTNLDIWRTSELDTAIFYSKYQWFDQDAK